MVNCARCEKTPDKGFQVKLYCDACSLPPLSKDFMDDFQFIVTAYLAKRGGACFECLNSDIRLRGADDKALLKMAKRLAAFLELHGRHVPKAH